MSLPRELDGRSYDWRNAGLGLAAREAGAARDCGRDCDCAKFGWGGCCGGCGDGALTLGDPPRVDWKELRPAGVPYVWAGGAAAVFARGLPPAFDAAYGLGDAVRLYEAVGGACCCCCC
jgi:hypothetical protein